jgi:hypothetical protein
VTKPMQMIALAAMFSFTLGSAARAQDKPSQPATPLKFQVVIARYQGDKKISSLPYTLSVNATAAGSSASLRIGARIPVATALGPIAPGTEGKQLSTLNYQDVGTNIDCFAATLDDGRFRVQVTVDDSSVYPNDEGKPGGPSGHPSFRSFRASNSLVLKDGQTAQFTAATDKLTGEIVRIDVTLTVVK